jgi:hypothetical protein
VGALRSKGTGALESARTGSTFSAELVGQEVTAVEGPAESPASPEITVSER